MKSFILKVASLTCLFAFLSSNLHADTREPLKIGVVGYTDPYFIINENGSFSGLDIDILHEIFARIGTPISISHYPRARLNLLAENKALDGLLFSFPLDAELLPDLRKSDVIYHIQSSIFTLKNSMPEEDNSVLDHFEGQSIAMIRGFPFAGNIQHFLSKMDLNLVNKDGQLVKMLTLGRVDAVIAEDLSFVMQARKLNVFDKIIAAAELKSFTVKFVFIDADNKLITDFDRELQHLIKTDYIDNRITHYLSRWVN